jgi:hypothetical protein
MKLKKSDLYIVIIDNTHCKIKYKNKIYTVKYYSTKTEFIKKIHFKQFIIFYSIATNRIYKIIKKWL